MFRSIGSVLSSEDSLNRVTAIASSEKLFALSTFDCMVFVFDSSLARKDKLTVRSSESAVKSVVTCMSFSPDGNELAMGHSDGSVTVYRLKDGFSLSERHSISTCVSCIAWVNDGLIVGAAEGSLWGVKRGLNRVARLDTGSDDTSRSSIVGFCTISSGAAAFARSDGSLYLTSTPFSSPPKFLSRLLNPPIVGIASFDDQLIILTSIGVSLVTNEGQTLATVPGIFSFLSSGNFCIVGGTDGFCKIDISSGNLKLSQKNVVGNFLPSAVEIFGSKIVMGGSRGGVEIFEEISRFSVKGKLIFAQQQGSTVQVGLKSEETEFNWLGNIVVGVLAEEVISGSLLKSEDGFVIGACVVSLADPYTIQVNILGEKNDCMHVHKHTQRIVYMEISSFGKKLAFRDIRGGLFSIDLRDFKKSVKPLISSSCCFSKFVENSGVLVAANHAELFVFYSDSAAVQPLDSGGMIKVQISSINRQEGRTIVIGNTESGGEVEFELDENLTNFHVFVESRDFKNALVILDGIGMTDEVKSLWIYLAEEALSIGSLQSLEIAAICFANLGDIAKAKKIKDGIRSYGNVTNKKFQGFYTEPVLNSGERTIMIPAIIPTADNLFLSRKFTEAFSEFVKINNFEKAAECAIFGDRELFQKMILWENDKLISIKNLPDRLIERGRLKEASEILLKFKRQEEAIELLYSEEEWELLEKIDKSEFIKKIAKLKLKSFLADSATIKSPNQKLERFLVIADLPEDLVLLYNSIGDWEGLVKTTRKHFPNLLSDTLKKAAQESQKEGRLKNAENFFFQGGFWVLATQMYKNLGKWSDAKRVALTGGGKIAWEKVCFAEALAKEAEKPEAGIEMLLGNGLREQAINLSCESKNFSRALKIARGAETQGIFLKRAMHLESISDWEGAEQDFIKAGHPREAVDMWVSGRNFQQALKVAEAEDPESISPITEAWSLNLLDSGHVDGAVAVWERGGLEPLKIVQIIKQKGYEEDSIKIAKRLGIVSKTAGSGASTSRADFSLPNSIDALIRSGKFEEGLAGAKRSGSEISFFEKYINFYSKKYREAAKAIGSERGISILKQINHEKESNELIQTIESFAESLISTAARSQTQDLTDALSLTQRGISIFHENDKFKKLSEIHKCILYMYNREIATKLNLSPLLIFKLSLSLCRQIDIYPIDRALYDAGCDSVNISNESAFYFLNRYLDVADAIADGSSPLTENDFEGTDIPFTEIYKFPNPPIFGDIEPIKERVLNWSVDARMEQKIPLISCEKCGNPKYSHSLKCVKCNFIAKSCIVTGAPVTDEIKCENCNSSANKDDWREWIGKVKTCPYCQT